VIIMARTGYSTKLQGETLARGKANEIPISPKHAIEIARFIKNKKTAEAVAYLEDVVAKKKPIPFRKFNRNVAHKRGLIWGEISEESLAGLHPPPPFRYQECGISWPRHGEPQDSSYRGEQGPRIRRCFSKSHGPGFSKAPRDREYRDRG
jgi:hypothetical protein